MTSWKKLLEKACSATNETIEDITTTMTVNELNEEFDDGYGGANGCSFTAWGKDYVYFPICYDGAEWVGYAPRNPCDIKMDHQGG